MKQYIDKIFEAFTRTGCRVGQGGMFIRQWNFEKSTTQAYKIHLIDTLYILIQNGLIELSDPNGRQFLKLTQAGYDYIQGGDLILSNLNLAELIDCSEPKDKIYNRLWDFIGKDGEAPLFIKGSVFFDAIAPYLGLSSYTYSGYTKKLHDKGESTSRISWYRDLFMGLKNEYVEPFLYDLSRKIIAVYQPMYMEAPETEDPDKENSNFPSQFWEENKTDNAVAEPKRKIFISYTWEKDTTLGHFQWVRQLADKLVKEGFEVFFDQYQRLGTDMNQFMVSSVKSADRILLICTPTFKQRSDDMENTCGFEASMISNELIRDVTSIKFLPIVRIREPEDVLPQYLGNRNALVWHTDSDDDAKFQRLVADLKA